MNAGWYPDPNMPGQHRYWDGQQWTPHAQSIVPAPLPMPPAPLPAPMPPGSMAQYGQQYPAQYPGYSVAAKNPAVSLLISFFIPGVGSMVNGDVGLGIGILAGYMISWVLTIVIIGFFGILAFWIWGMVDAYQGAVRWNRSHGIVS